MQIIGEDLEEMTPELDEFYTGSESYNIPGERRSTGLVVALIAAASALAGGLAAAWYYRKALSRLQHAASNSPDSKFGIPVAQDDEEL